MSVTGGSTLQEVWSARPEATRRRRRCRFGGWRITAFRALRALAGRTKRATCCRRPASGAPSKRRNLVVGSHRGGVLVECTARLDPVGGDAYHCLSGQHNALVTPAGFEGLWAVQVRKILRVA